MSYTLVICCIDDLPSKVCRNLQLGWKPQGQVTLFVVDPGVDPYDVDRPTVFGCQAMVHELDGAVEEYEVEGTIENWLADPKNRVAEGEAAPSAAEHLAVLAQKALHSHAPMETERLLRIAKVEDLVGMKKSMIYQQVKDCTFPKPVRIGARSVAWRMSEVQAWLHKRHKPS